MIKLYTYHRCVCGHGGLNTRSYQYTAFMRKEKIVETRLEVLNPHVDPGLSIRSWVYINIDSKIAEVLTIDPYKHQNAATIPVISFQNHELAATLQRDITQKGMIFQIRQYECGSYGLFVVYEPSEPVRFLMRDHIEETYCPLNGPIPPNTRRIADFSDYASAKAELDSLEAA